MKPVAKIWSPLRHTTFHQDLIPWLYDSELQYLKPFWLVHIERYLSAENAFYSANHLPKSSAKRRFALSFAPVTPRDLFK